MTNLDVWLVRHGETAWSLTGQHTGRTDIPLTANGERQAATLAPVLRAQTFTRVLTSPLRRAKDTCNRAGLGQQAIDTADLMEWDYGIFDGQTASDIQRDLPDWNIWSSPIPNGESLLQVSNRVERVIASLQGTTGAIAIFAHGHLLRIFAARWLGLQPSAGALFALDPASISILRNDGSPTIVTWNDTTHSHGVL